MSLTTEVPISLNHDYQVHIGRNLWPAFRDFCSRHFPSRKLLVMIDEKVKRLHGQRVHEECSKYFEDVVLVTVPEGERSKSITMWNKCLDKLLKEGIERTTPLLAVGGGVTGDLAGFVAASALRGIPLVHMPTSLLAMVDSSVGGKTGVNHERGKNLIGSFYHPDAVFADIDFLETLAAKEWINGLAEILKYAAISKPPIFDTIADALDSGFSPNDSWKSLVHESVSIKAEIVAKDSLESGVRAFLNFGHTFGHALEKSAGYGTISHGEAVFIGMLAALEASRSINGNLDEQKLAPFIKLYAPQPEIASLDVPELIEIMKQDKKVKDEEIRLILLKQWGSPYVHTCRDHDLLHESWQKAFEIIKTDQLSY